MVPQTLRAQPILYIALIRRRRLTFALYSGILLQLQFLNTLAFNLSHRLLRTPPPLSQQHAP